MKPEFIFDNPKISIIMPAYNEEKTIETIINKIDEVELGIYNLKKELIVVDDGSTDKTEKIIKELTKKFTYIKYIKHLENRGKGGAVKTGINKASGDIIIIQDADLEYNPHDYFECVLPILQGKAKVVYGSRFLSEKNPVKYKMNWIATQILNFIVLMLYLQKITDEPTCYKTFDAKLIKNIKIDGEGFEWEPEITAKILKKKVRIYEMPISYTPRSYQEGKKISYKDGIKAIWTLIRYRFVN